MTTALTPRHCRDLLNATAHTRDTLINQFHQPLDAALYALVLHTDTFTTDELAVVAATTPTDTINSWIARHPFIATTGATHHINGQFALATYRRIATRAMSHPA